MKFKLDENLPIAIAIDLSDLGHDVDTSPSEGLAGLPDEDIWCAAQAAERFLITQDMDFSDVRKFSPGTHFGLLLIRLRDPSRGRLIERIQRILDRSDIESWARCFVVATEQKIRVRRPVLAPPP